MQDKKISDAFIRAISIDVTEAKECAVPQDEFRIIDFSNVAGSPFEDLVHNKKPYLHFQILRPKDPEQRERALQYFREHNKIFATFTDRQDIILYVGCTENVYIKSVIADVEDDDIMNLLPQAAHWLRHYGNIKSNI